MHILHIPLQGVTYKVHLELNQLSFDNCHFFNTPNSLTKN
jgi:hypothetical protein